MFSLQHHLQLVFLFCIYVSLQDGQESLRTHLEKALLFPTRVKKRSPAIQLSRYNRVDEKIELQITNMNGLKKLLHIVVGLMFM